jgi:glycosyltransferase involved in cell wall biosynthesis
MDTQFSLVITTYNRFDSFLDRYLEKYLENPYISEIIISDDCSDDYDKLIAKYGTNDKIKIYKNSSNIGALKNKCIACQKSTTDWICLMDSDNFCHKDYFEALMQYWNKDINTIYAPSKALPVFDYSHHIGKPININNIDWNTVDECLINTGNYIFHKSIVQFIEPIIQQQLPEHTIDVKYMNYLWLNNGVEIVVVPNMEYLHVIHNQSYYALCSDKLSNSNKTFNWHIYPPNF